MAKLELAKKKAGDEPGARELSIPKTKVQLEGEMWPTEAQWLLMEQAALRGRTI